MIIFPLLSDVKIIETTTGHGAKTKAILFYFLYDYNRTRLKTQLCVVNCKRR